MPTFRHARRPRLALRLVAALFAGAFALSFVGACQRQIGDGCGTDTDCSLNYDRRCDLTQQGGYCTIPECDPDRCPGQALCVEFNGNDSRLSRRFCMSSCETDGDCRGGYVCLGASTTCDPDTGSGQFPECTRVLDSVPSPTRPRAKFCVQSATIPR